jgi:hypothetical protein
MQTRVLLMQSLTCSLALVYLSLGRRIYTKQMEIASKKFSCCVEKNNKKKLKKLYVREALLALLNI